MNASTRVALTTGAAALSLGALVVTASVPPESMRAIQVVRPATFAADISVGASDAPVEHLSEEDLNSAFALIEQLAPVADGRVVTVTLDNHDRPETVTIAPAKATATEMAGASPVGRTGQAAAEGPVAYNAASDLIDSVYAVSRYWANYVSLELGPWLINWLPFGYLISDQIYIWYPDFVLPTVDSFVYDFLDPVVNDPLNPTVWIDGVGAIVNTAANGIVKGISDEIEYIVTFGWFPIPLPPLPDFPLPGLGSPSASVLGAAGMTAEAVTEPVDSDGATTGPATDEAPAAADTAGGPAGEVEVPTEKGGPSDAGSVDASVEESSDGGAANDTEKDSAETEATESAAEAATEADEESASAVESDVAESGDTSQSGDSSESDTGTKVADSDSSAPKSASADGD